MAIKNAYLLDLLQRTEKRNSNEPEFIQAVTEVFSTLEPVIEKRQDSSVLFFCYTMSPSAKPLLLQKYINSTHIYHKEDQSSEMSFDNKESIKYKYMLESISLGSKLVWYYDVDKQVLARKPSKSNLLNVSSDLSIVTSALNTLCCKSVWNAPFS